METKSQKEIVAAGVVVVREDGKILCVQEAREDAYGQWNLPMGRVEASEDTPDCAVREGGEETGFNLKILYEVGAYHFSMPYGRGVVCCHIFAAEIVGGQMAAPAEADMLDIKWLSLEEIGGLPLIDPIVLDMIRDYQAGRRV